MKILESLEPVLISADHVSINEDLLARFADSLIDRKIDHWSTVSPVDFSGLRDEEKASFLFIFNAVSFSYWGEPKWRIKSGFDRGTLNMIASIERARQEGIPILDSSYLADLDNLEYILRGEGRIPLLEERQRILREVGSVISSRYDGSFLKFAANSNRDAQDIANRVIDEFPSFYDSAIYGGQEVTFHKRAQLLASDIAKVFGFDGTESLTACADYIIPLVLRYRGILEYSLDLALKIDNKEEIIKGSKEEVEIRAHTVYAVELIRQRLKDMFTSMQLNDYLWLAGDSVPEKEQYHLTRTTAY